MPEPSPIPEPETLETPSDVEPARVEAGRAADETADAGADPGVEQLLRRFLSLPPIEIVRPTPDPLPVDRAASTKPPSRPPSPEVLESFDAKLAEVEPLLKEARWDAIVEVLSKRDTLPPPLALLYAIALREREAKGDPEGVAIRAVAALLCVPEESETALVIAKRLLRKNPVGWQRRSAPSATVSIVIVLVVAILGALVGLLAGPGMPLFR